MHTLIAYKLIRSNRKTLGLTVDKSGNVIVRAPMRISEAAVHDFVHRHTAWIRKHQEASQKRLQEHPPLAYGQGEKIPVLGRTLTLQIGQFSEVREQGDKLELPLDQNPQAAVEGYLRALAKAYLPDRVRLFAGPLNVQPTGIKITGAKSRWGSCSGKNSLCFAFRLICLPPALVDAVVVHELAHIHIKNHSPAFYRLVEQVLPDYQNLHRELQRQAYLLKI